MNSTVLPTHVQEVPKRMRSIPFKVTIRSISCYSVAISSRSIHFMESAKYQREIMCMFETDVIRDSKTISVELKILTVTFF